MCAVETCQSKWTNLNLEAGTFIAKSAPGFSATIRFARSMAVVAAEGARPV